MIATNLLKNSYMFSRLSEERLAEINISLETRELAAGEVLFNMGEPGDELFIVEAGQVAIYAPNKDNPGQEKPIRIFRAGGILGEMALIDSQPRSLSARALEPSRVLVLDGENFRYFVKQDHNMAFAVMYGLSDRIRYTTEFLNEVRSWVGRVTQGDYSSDQFLDEVRGWVKQVSAGEYQETFAPKNNQDQTLSSLAAEFAKMAAMVQEREKELQKEIAQLKIEINEAKRKEDVQGIKESDYFRSLQAQAKAMREKNESS
jgi:CRP-like cAMP-binding protein